MFSSLQSRKTWRRFKHSAVFTRNHDLLSLACVRFC